MRGGVGGCPTGGTRRKRIWIARVGQEGEIECGRGWRTDEDRLGRLVGDLSDVLGGGSGNVLPGDGELAQSVPADGLWQGRWLGGGHGDSGGAFAVGFRVYRADGGGPGRTAASRHETRMGRGERNGAIGGRFVGVGTVVACGGEGGCVDVRLLVGSVHRGRERGVECSGGGVAGNLGEGGGEDK